MFLAFVGKLGGFREKCLGFECFFSHVLWLNIIIIFFFLVVLL